MTYEQEMEQLEQELSGITDFMERMEHMDKIIDVKKRHGKLNPGGEYYQCEGCSA